MIFHLRQILFISIFSAMQVCISIQSAAEEFCPRLEGINLKCMIPNPPGTPPPGGGRVCPVEERPITCNVASGMGTVRRPVTNQVCVNWTCDVENSPEGLPRYRSQCTERVTCCDVEEIQCATGRTTVDGTMTIGPSCEVSRNCGAGSGGGGEGMQDCPSGGGSGGGDCNGLPSCNGAGSGAPACPP
jgi:hypothetical protein